jgi:quercetin dioxygenase-like cupin family protein
MYQVTRAGEIVFEAPAAYAPHAHGHGRAAIVGRHTGSVHTGLTQCTLDGDGTVGAHLHSFEKSFYVLEGRPQLTLDGRTWQLEPADCGVVPVGVPRGGRVARGEPCRWVEASAPAPRDAGPPDT